MLKINYAVDSWFFQESHSYFQKWTKKMSKIDFPKKVLAKKSEYFPTFNF